MSAFFTYAFFPLHFAGALMAGYWAYSQGYSASVVLAVVTGVTAAIIFVLERVHPAHPEWNRSQKDVGTDSLHALVSMIMLPKLLEFMLLHVAFITAASEVANASDGAGLWPSHWPLAAQVGLALLISQFGEYWVHRTMHTVPLLWRLHATHHSPGRLYWLNAARFHPLDTATSYLVGMVPLLTLGVEGEVILLFHVWISVHGMYQHCNVRLKLGPLNYIFSMAELHRWHHSLLIEEANQNYGNNIIFWDLVFGTFYHPKDREASSDIGLSEMPHFPTDYIGQVLSPFQWSKVARRDDP
jgi:sterol desaturase/sphingolipid hydroxylase (fatty acid hydroxylase superfamily)